MALITNENREAWQAMADRARATFPNVGKTVKIIKGRKHLNKVGIVTWHGVNRFYSIRYKTDAQLMLMDIFGREGYSVRVKTEAGETFYVPAEYTEVIK